jgi:uncharacterized protein (AIM24 family)
MRAHEIEYQILVRNAICRNRTGSPEIIAEAGSFMMMDNNIQMETILAMVQNNNPVYGKLLNAVKSLNRRKVFS